MRNKILVYPFILIIVLIVLFFNFTSFGSREVELDSGYIFDQYNVNMDVADDRSVTVKETITVTFKEESHGFYRYIPLKYNMSYYDENGKLKSKYYRASVSELAFAPVSANVQKDGIKVVDYGANSDLFMIAIGNSDKTIKGTYTIAIGYKLKLPDDREKDYDLFYHNIIGAGMDTSINSLTFSINFPTLISEEQDLKFYVGKYGETNSSKKVNYLVNGKNISGSVVNLDYGEAVTIYTRSANGYFKDNQDHSNISLILIIFGLALLLGIGIFWLIKRRKEPIIEVVEFAPIEEFTPTEVGYLNDGKLTGDDISSLIVYWANKGYVTLENKEKEVIIHRGEGLPDSAKKHEKTLYKALFRNKQESISAKSLNKSDMLSAAGEQIKNQVETDMKKYFDRSIENVSYVFCILTSLLVLLLKFITNLRCGYLFASNGKDIMFLLGYIVLVIALFAIPSVSYFKEKKGRKTYLILSIVELFVLLGSMIMISLSIETYMDPYFARVLVFLPIFALFAIYPSLEIYTKEAKRILGRIRGLKQFIVVAEKDRLEVLVKDNPELFYEIVPYAYVLGVSKVYMDKFKDIPLNKVEWVDSIDVLWLTLYNLDNFMYAIGRNMLIGNFKNIAGTVARTAGSIGGFSGGGSGGGGSGRF